MRSEGKQVMNTECEKLASRFEQMRGHGLVDVKFLLRNTDETTAEEVCGEVNAMLSAFERGDAVKLDFCDGAS